MFATVRQVLSFRNADKRRGIPCKPAIESLEERRLLSLDLYVGSLGNRSVMRYDGITGRPLPAPGAEGAIFARGCGLVDPEGTAQGADGHLYVSNFTLDGNDTVIKYDANGGCLGDFVTPGSGGLRGAQGLRFGPDGNLYVASWFTNQIMRYDGYTGMPLPAPGQAGAVFATGCGLVNPYDFVFGPDGHLYVPGARSDNIVRYDGTTGQCDGVFVTSVPMPGTPAFDPDGNLHVSSGDFGTQVLKFDGRTGSFMAVSASGGGLSRPRGLAFKWDDDEIHRWNLYVASFGTHSVLRFRDDGSFRDAFIPPGSGGLNGPRQLAFIGLGYLKGTGSSLEATVGQRFASVVSSMTHFAPTPGSMQDNSTAPGRATDYVAFLDWGDGSALGTGGVERTGTNTFDVAGSHRYATAGEYWMTIYVYDARNFDRYAVAYTYVNVVPTGAPSGGGWDADLLATLDAVHGDPWKDRRPDFTAFELLPR